MYKYNNIDVWKRKETQYEIAKSWYRKNAENNKKESSKQEKRKRKKKLFGKGLKCIFLRGIKNDHCVVKG